MVAQEAEHAAPNFDRRQQVRQLRRDHKARRYPHRAGFQDGQ
jgi:hypothetical protein